MNFNQETASLPRFKISFLSLFIIFFIIIYSCKNDDSNKDFIKKLNSKEITSIIIYAFCTPLYEIKDTNLIFNVCNTVVNVSPERLISNFNKIDSITSKQEIMDYKNFFLNYDKQYPEEVRLKDNIDLRVVLLLNFENKSVDTLSFISNNQIQVNESTVQQFAKF